MSTGDIPGLLFPKEQAGRMDELKGTQSPLVAVAFIMALVAALLEAPSPWGTDNLTVPIGVSLLLFWPGF